MLPSELRTIRQALQMSQAEFGERIGFCLAQVHKMEIGTRNIRRPTELAIKGLLLELTRTDLIGICTATPNGGSDGPHEWDFQPIE